MIPLTGLEKVKKITPILLRYRLFFLKTGEFRLKRPHRDMVGENEADPEVPHCNDCGTGEGHDQPENAPV